MKGYPLIYSRTKNFDFVPNFLVRPKDLDCQLALKYVKNAMENLDFIQGIRYTAFPVENYCVCGGIACISAKLVDQLKSISVSFLSKYPNVEDYLRDCKGRNLACFIGIAIPKSEARKDMIPDIPLEQYWKIYFEYLKHQWLSEIDTHSELLDMPPIDIAEKRYINGSYVPKAEKYGNREAIKKDLVHEQQTLDYFFHLIMNGSDNSIITEIENRTEWENLSFRTAIVSDTLYQTLKSTPLQSSSMGSPLLRNKGTGKGKESGEVGIRRSDNFDGEKSEKKTKMDGIPKGSVIIIVGIVVLIILLLLITTRE